MSQAIFVGGLPSVFKARPATFGQATREADAEVELPVSFGLTGLPSSEVPYQCFLGPAQPTAQPTTLPTISSSPSLQPSPEPTLPSDDGPDNGTLQEIGDAVVDYWSATKNLLKDIWGAFF